MTKRLLLLIGAILLVLVSGIFVSRDDVAQAGDGAVFGPRHLFYKIPVDSTVVTNIDSTGWTGAPLWRFDGVKTYSRLEGWFSAAYVAPFDTGTAGTKADTTKDSLYFELWRGDANGNLLERLYQSKQSAFKVQASRTYVSFKISSDSALYDYVIPRVVYFLTDSTHTKARTGAGITFDVWAKLWAKQ